MSRRHALLLALALWPAWSLGQPSEGRVYAPGPFEQLDIEGAAQVRLSQADRDEVIVQGGGNVDVQLVDGRLRINPSGDWKFWNSDRLQVHVRMRKLTRLSLSGTGDVHAPARFVCDRLSISISGAGLARFDDLKAAQLRFDISGAGDGQLAGQVDEFKLAISGKGKVAAEQLRAGLAVVAISGVGQARLWAVDELRVGVSGVGHVDYWGEPTVKRGTTGIATVNSLGPRR